MTGGQAANQAAEILVDPFAMGETMTDHQTDLQTEIPIRLHYQIQQGQLCLPSSVQLQIILKKRELQAILRWLGRSYIQLLCHGRPDEAERVLACYRGLEEPNFGELFANFGYPDEAQVIRTSCKSPVEG